MLARPTTLRRRRAESILGMDAVTPEVLRGRFDAGRATRRADRAVLYENKYERTGGAQVTLPIIGGGFSLGGSGSYCHAIVRIVDGRVAAVNYAGDNDDMIGKEGVCAPIFRGA